MTPEKINKDIKFNFCIFYMFSFIIISIGFYFNQIEGEILNGMSDYTIAFNQLVYHVSVSLFTLLLAFILNIEFKDNKKYNLLMSLYSGVLLHLILSPLVLTMTSHENNIQYIIFNLIVSFVLNVIASLSTRKVLLDNLKLDDKGILI